VNATAARPSRLAPRERPLRSPLMSSLLLAGAVSLGLVLRAVLYAANRSLTLDESFVALNVARHSTRGLLGRLDWNSAAPVGVLELTKFATTLLGSSEYALRTPAFLASVASVIVFAWLARDFASRAESILAVGIFAALALPLSYAAIAKPYAFDVLAATALLLATLKVLAHPGKTTTLVSLAALGVIAPVFSYASVFSVAASSTVLVAVALRHHTTNAIRARLLSLVGLWGVLLVLAYFWHRSSFQHLQRTFGSGHLSSFQSLRDVLGAARIVLGVSPQASAVGSVVAAIATVGVGLFLGYGLFVLARRAWEVAALLLLPALFAAVGSAAELYPLLPRTMLFLVPSLAIALAAGVIASFRLRRSALIRPIATLFVLAIVVAQIAAVARVLEPIYRDAGLKPALQELATDRRTDTTLYFGYATQYPLAFYLSCRCAGDVAPRALKNQAGEVVPQSGTLDQWSPALVSHSPRVVLGSFQGYGLSGYDRDFARLGNRPRVWIVLSFLSDKERRALVGRLDRLGKRLKTLQRGKGVDAVSAYLYDLRSHGGG
jgi:hypothetical protein